MGVNITFTFGHKLKNISMAEVSRRCDGMNDTFEEVARFWSHGYPHLGPPLKPWRDAGAHDVGQPFYQAPAGFSFTFGSSAVRLHHVCRFRIFTQDIPARTLLRRFARQCCEILGGDRVIYSPDEDVGDKILDLVTDNCTIADVEAELLRLSPPAITFDELDYRWCPPWPKPAAYYVDACQNISLPITGTT
jgi:hypothetical protein